MSTGCYKITDQGAMYFVSFVPKVRDGMGRCFYKKRVQRCSARNFEILPGKKRSGAYGLCMMSNPLHSIISAEAGNMAGFLKLNPSVLIH